MSSHLAQPPSGCCLQGVKHSGDPAGKLIKLDDIDCYVSYPSGKEDSKFKKIVLFYPDVFGPRYINNKLLMDCFAENGKHILFRIMIEVNSRISYHLTRLLFGRRA